MGAIHSFKHNASTINQTILSTLSRAKRSSTSPTQLDRTGICRLFPPTLSSQLRSNFHNSKCPSTRLVTLATRRRSRRLGSRCRLEVEAIDGAEQPLEGGSR